MKQKINKLLSLLFLGIIIMIFGCKKDTLTTDTVPPSQISNITFTPFNGGGYFRYTVPKDEDFLFVKAVYKLDTGEEIFRVSSVFSDSLGIEGLGSVKTYEIRLYSVDRSGNQSEAIVESITPLKSNPDQVLSTVSIFAAFSGVDIHWTDSMKSPIKLFVTFNFNGNEIVRIASTNVQNGFMNISGLTPTGIDFSAYIMDDFGNKTAIKPLGTITPYEDFKIDKKSWTFLRDELLPADTLYEDTYDEAGNLIDSKPKTKKTGYYPTTGPAKLQGWNAMEIGHESNIEEFWDDIIDDWSKLTMNYFSTNLYQTCPFSYYIDLNKTVMATRCTVWPRDSDGIAKPYDRDDVKWFEIWTSNDKVHWERLRSTMKNVKPSNPADQKAQAKEGYSFPLYDGVPKYSRPFRYMEYRGIAYWQPSVSEGCMSEITIFGKVVSEGSK